MLALITIGRKALLLSSFALLLLLTQAVSGQEQAPAAPAAPWFETPPALCSAPLEPVQLVNPTVITDCSESALSSALAQGGHITFACGPDPVTIPVSSPLVTSATEDIVLDGAGLVTLDGQGITRIIEKPFTPNAHIDKTLGNDLTLQRIRLVNGRAPAATGRQDADARGGAVWATSPGTRLHIIDAVFEDNATTSIDDEDNQGGAVYAANIYETVIVGSTFARNVAGNGGAFGAIATGLVVANSHFTENEAADTTAAGIVRGHGGAIHLDGVTNSFNDSSRRIVDVCGSDFTGNLAVRGGGALKVTISDNKGTKASYVRSTFRDNRLVGEPAVEGHGGAIYHIEDDFAGGTGEDNIEIRESTFTGNYSQHQGGGAWILVRGHGRIENTTFSENQAATAGTNSIGQGGGLVISGGIIDIVNTTFAWNFATFQGGAMHAGGSGDPGRVVTLANSLFYENRLDPTHTNPVTTRWQGYHTNRPLQDGGNNLQFPDNKAPHWDNTVNNLIVEPASAILIADPLLGDLGDHGGPTPTRPLAASSPAVDAAGSAACPATDQRGVLRDQGAACDIGAYERVLALRVAPALISAGEETVLTVRGAGFSAGQNVLWDGQPLPTTFVDPLTLRATAGSGDTATAGTVQITVSASDLAPAQVGVVPALRRLLLPAVRR